MRKAMTISAALAAAVAFIMVASSQTMATPAIAAERKGTLRQVPHRAAGTQRLRQELQEVGLRSAPPKKKKRIAKGFTQRSKRNVLRVEDARGDRRGR